MNHVIEYRIVPRFNEERDRAEARIERRIVARVPDEWSDALVRPVICFVGAHTKNGKILDREGALYQVRADAMRLVSQFMRYDVAAAKRLGLYSEAAETMVMVADAKGGPT